MKTLYELVRYLLDASDTSDTDAVDVRRSILSARSGSDEICNRHQWKDYRKVVNIKLNAPVPLTINVDASGGCDVITGTLPTWFAEGSVVIEGARSPCIVGTGGFDFAIRQWKGGAESAIPVTMYHDRYITDDQIRVVDFLAETNSDGYASDCATQCSLGEIRLWNLASLRTPCGSLQYGIERISSGGQRVTEFNFMPVARAMSIRIRYHRLPALATLCFDCGAISPITSQPGKFTIQKAISGSHARTGLAIAIMPAISDQTEPFFAGIDRNVFPVTSAESATALTIDSEYQHAAGDRGVLTHVLDFPDFAWLAATLFADAHHIRIARGEPEAHNRALRDAVIQMQIAAAQETATSSLSSSPNMKLVDDADYWY